MRILKRIRFSVKSLIVLVTIAAVLLSIWPMLQDHYAQRKLLASVHHRFIQVQDLGGGRSHRQPNEERICAAVDSVKRRNLERSVVTSLLSTFTCGDEEAQIHAAMALRRLGHAASDAVPVLTHALENGSDVALQAARALGSIGKGSEDDAGQLLARQFCDEELRINQRISAAEALIEIGQTSRLIGMMTEDDAVCLGLQAMFHAFQRPHATDDVPVAVSCLTHELSNKEQLNRQFAAWSLGVIGPSAADSIPALRVAQQDSCADVRKASTRAVAQISAQPVPRQAPE